MTSAQQRGPVRHHPARRASLKKTSSFKIRRMGDIVVCETCGQGHQPGRNHLYDYPDNMDEDLLCQVCQQPLVDPVDTPCAHTFCQACLRSHMRMQKTCPFDGQPLVRETDVRRSSTLVRNILDKLTVVCPNNAYCDQLMPRHALETHLRYQCPGTYVCCPREEGEGGCGFVGPRNQLEEHLWSCTHGSDVDPKSESVASGGGRAGEGGRGDFVSLPGSSCSVELQYVNTLLDWWCTSSVLVCFVCVCACFSHSRYFSAQCHLVLGFRTFVPNQSSACGPLCIYLPQLMLVAICYVAGVRIRL